MHVGKSENEWNKKKRKHFFTHSRKYGEKRRAIISSGWKIEHPRQNGKEKGNFSDIYNFRLSIFHRRSWFKLMIFIHFSLFTVKKGGNISKPPSCRHIASMWEDVYSRILDLFGELKKWRMQTYYSRFHLSLWTGDNCEKRCCFLLTSQTLEGWNMQKIIFKLFLPVALWSPSPAGWHSTSTEVYKQSTIS